ncbi:serine hydrolase domain-containing protein [Roseibium sediminicola]|uniref:Beta-lactamase family protein n=1 Tax=Roseibium sediminicola TaxID=2933272 RepID=A0ABT0GU26_9HYPH|nr:serine hydrolase domain-containing protein [Roseibium sp. CAU 1639]MCK7612938.1 beta-lactamase family protein [Roseibium sp. CAU 1639]
MPRTDLSRRLFLSTSAASLALMPVNGIAQTLSPAQTPGVEVPPGQIDAAIAELPRIAADIMARSGIPGLAIAVVHEGQTVFAEGYGLRRADLDDPVTPDTVFQLASLSKPVGATVVARQVGEGVVAWESRMRDLLPWFSLSDPARSEKLTIGDLYSHRSGLPDHAGDDLEDLGFDRQTILERLRLLPLNAFRTSYAYTNFGLTAAAEAVAQASGKDWASLSEEALYGPLGMTGTSSRFEDFMAAENRAIPHARDGDTFAPLFQRDPDAQSPAGGVSSTANDLAIWLKMVLANGRHGGDQIIAPEALLPALSPQSFSGQPRMPDARAGFYGFGFNVGVEPSGRVKLGHSGAFLMGSGTCFSMIPSLDLGIVVLTNAAPVGAAEGIAAAFTDLAQFGRETRDWYSGYAQRFEAFFSLHGRTVGQEPPAAAAPPPAASEVVGRYAHPYFGTVEVNPVGTGLVLSAGPEPQHYALNPWDGPVMVFDFVTENAPLGSRSTLTFAEMENGPAQSLEIELFGEDGPVWFHRV